MSSTHRHEQSSRSGVTPRRVCVRRRYLALFAQLGKVSEAAGLAQDVLERAQRVLVRRRQVLHLLRRNYVVDGRRETVEKQPKVKVVRALADRANNAHGESASAAATWVGPYVIGMRNEPGGMPPGRRSATTRPSYPRPNPNVSAMSVASEVTSVVLRTSPM